MSWLILFKVYRHGDFQVLLIVGWSPKGYIESHWRSTRYTVTHVRNKNSHIQDRSPNEINVISIPKGTVLKGKNSLPLGAKSFPVRDVPIWKRDAIEENHCLFQ